MKVPLRYKDEQAILRTDWFIDLEIFAAPPFVRWLTLLRVIEDPLVANKMGFFVIIHQKTRTMRRLG